MFLERTINSVLACAEPFLQRRSRGPVISLSAAYARSPCGDCMHVCTCYVCLVTCVCVCVCVRVCVCVCVVSNGSFLTVHTYTQFHTHIHTIHCIHTHHYILHTHIQSSDSENRGNRTECLLSNFKKRGRIPQGTGGCVPRGRQARGQKLQRPIASIRLPVVADLVSGSLVKELVGPVQVAQRAVA